MGKNKNDLRRNVWTECVPEALQKQVPSGAQGFSAVGYFFGKKLKDELVVPVGLIETAAGGTVIESWSPPSGGHFVSLVQPLVPFALSDS